MWSRLLRSTRTLREALEGHQQHNHNASSSAPLTLLVVAGFAVPEKLSFLRRFAGSMMLASSSSSFSSNRTPSSLAGLLGQSTSSSDLQHNNAGPVPLIALTSLHLSEEACQAALRSGSSSAYRGGGDVDDDDDDCAKEDSSSSSSLSWSLLHDIMVLPVEAPSVERCSTDADLMPTVASMLLLSPSSTASSSSASSSSSVVVWYGDAQDILGTVVEPLERVLFLRDCVLSTQPSSCSSSSTSQHTYSSSGGGGASRSVSRPQQHRRRASSASSAAAPSVPSSTTAAAKTTTTSETSRNQQSSEAGGEGQSPSLMLLLSSFDGAEDAEMLTTIRRQLSERIRREFGGVFQIHILPASSSANPSSHNQHQKKPLAASEQSREGVQHHLSKLLIQGAVRSKRQFSSSLTIGGALSALVLQTISVNTPELSSIQGASGAVQPTTAKKSTNNIVSNEHNPQRIRAAFVIEDILKRKGTELMFSASSTSYSASQKSTAADCLDDDVDNDDEQFSADGRKKLGSSSPSRKQNQQEDRPTTTTKEEEFISATMSDIQREVLPLLPSRTTSTRSQQPPQPQQQQQTTEWLLSIQLDVEQFAQGCAVVRRRKGDVAAVVRRRQQLKDRLNDAVAVIEEVETSVL